MRVSPRYPSRYEVDCRIDRRKSIKAEPSKNLRSPQFKLRHYPNFKLRHYPKLDEWLAMEIAS